MNRNEGVEPTQTTPGGTEIPVPQRADFLADLGRAAKLAPEVAGTGYPPESVIPLMALARTTTTPDPDYCWYISHVAPDGTPSDAWLTRELAWKGFHMAHDWQTQERAEQALALLTPGTAEIVPDPRRVG